MKIFKVSKLPLGSESLSLNNEQIFVRPSVCLSVRPHGIIVGVLILFFYSIVYIFGFILKVIPNFYQPYVIPIILQESR